MRTLDRIRCECLLFTLLQIRTPEHTTDPHRASIPPRTTVRQEPDSRPYTRWQRPRTAAPIRSEMLMKAYSRGARQWCQWLNLRRPPRDARPLLWQVSHGYARLCALGVIARIHTTW